MSWMRAALLLAAVLSFQRGEVVVRTFPSVGLVPSMKFWTVTWLVADGSASRTLASDTIVHEVRLFAPAFDIAGDGCMVIYTTASGVARYDACAREPVGPEIATGVVNDVRFLPDGGFLVVARNVDRYDANGKRIASYGTFGYGWESVAVAPDGQSFWAANPAVYHFALDGALIGDSVWVPGSIGVDGMTVCGDWRAVPKRRAIRAGEPPRESPAPPE